MRFAQQFAGTLASVVLAFAAACTRPNPYYAPQEEADVDRPLPSDCFTPRNNSDYEATVSAKICQGQYENVRFTIRGDNVVLDGAGVALEARGISDLEYAAILVDTVSHVTVRGFTLRDYPIGVSATTMTPYRETVSVCVPIRGHPDACRDRPPQTTEEGSAHLTIEDVTVLGPGKRMEQSGAGIHVNGYGRVAITQNTVRKMNVGIRAEDVFHAAVIDNTVEENTAGIMLVLRPSLAGEDVMVANNRIGKNDYGIMKGGANVARIEDNEFYGNGKNML